MLLLRAALLPGEDALRAWRVWKSHVDLNAVDSPSYSLLPLLHRTLVALDVADADMARLAGVARSGWAGNQLLYRSGAIALRTLREAGVEALVTGGTALSLLHYSEAGLRRLSGFDAMVRPRDAARAMDALASAGLRMETLHTSRDAVIAFRDSVRFFDSGGQVFRLAWRLWPGGGLDAESDLWAAAHDFAAEGLSARALDRTSLLLWACAGAESWARIQWPLWVADAWMVISAPEGPDWGRFSAQARRLGLCLPACEALDCLVEALDAPVPVDVLRELRQSPGTRWERLAWRAQTSGRRGWGRVAGRLLRFVRLSQGQRLTRRLVAFPQYLQCVWNLRSVWQVPFHALLKAIREMWQRGD
jgi:hypothetical protein